MSLPFLQPRKIASVIIAHRSDAGEIKDQHEEGKPSPDLLRASEDLISAVHMKDAEGVASALQYAFECLDEAEDQEEEEEGSEGE